MTRGTFGVVKVTLSNPKNTIPTVRHSGDNIVLWVWFGTSGSATSNKVDGIMKNGDYLPILLIYLKSKARCLKNGHSWVFQQDNDPTAHIKTCSGTNKAG